MSFPVKTLKKAGVLSAATSLAAGVMFVGAASFASAAPVTITADTLNIAPGGSADVTIDGCVVGATLTIDAPLLYGEDNPQTDVLDEGWLPSTETFPYEFALDEDGELLFTELPITVTCTPPEGVEEEASTAGLTLNFYGDTYLLADPEEFFTGDEVTITAGDYLPGETVTLDVYPEGTDESVFSTAIGTAAEDFSVTGVVVFPADLECGNYDLVFASETSAVEGTLYICGAPEPSPTPTPTEAPTVAPTPTPTETVVPTPTVSATATTAPTSRPQPGLPSTGN